MKHVIEYNLYVRVHVYHSILYMYTWTFLNSRTATFTLMYFALSYSTDHKQLNARSRTTRTTGFLVWGRGVS